LIYIDSAAGQVTCHRSYGQSRKWGVWNAYNRQPTYLKAGDPTSSWAYNTNAWRPSNNNANNSLTVFCGLAEQTFDFYFLQLANNESSTSTLLTGIGVNSTTGPSGYIGFCSLHLASGGGVTLQRVARYKSPPLLGVNVITALENTQAAAGSETYNGTESSMLLSADWNA